MLAEEELKEAWKNFIEILSSNKNHSAVSNLQSAVLNITGDNSFDIIAASNIHQKFIEAERSSLIHHLQTFFNNKLLKYRVLVQKSTDVPQVKEISLTSKQQFQLIVEQYPLVKELKDRLRLELDY